MRLIINADDLGMSRGANRAIGKACEEGCITHASIMTNTEYFDEALRDVVQKCLHLGVGLHINLTYGRPVSAADKVSLLINAEGKFSKTFFGLLKRKKDRDFREQVELEIEAQMMKALNNGIRLTHLDSHQHIHCIPYINEIVVNLARKYGIARVRELNESFLGTIKIAGSVFCILNINTVKFVILKFLRRNSERMRKVYFFSIICSGKVKREHIEGIRVMKEYDVVEIMLHPSYPKLDMGSSIEPNSAKRWLLCKDRERELNCCLESKGE